MVSFDLSFILMLMKDIFEDEGALWTEGRISWISINRDSYQINKVQVVNGFFCTYAGVLLGVDF